MVVGSYFSNAARRRLSRADRKGTEENFGGRRSLEHGMHHGPSLGLKRMKTEEIDSDSDSQLGDEDGMRAAGSIITVRDSVPRTHKSHGKFERGVSPDRDGLGIENAPKGRRGAGRRSRVSLMALGKHPEIENLAHLVGGGHHGRSPMQFKEYMRKQMKALEQSITTEYESLWETMHRGESQKHLRDKVDELEQQVHQLRKKIERSGNGNSVGSTSTVTRDSDLRHFSTRSGGQRVRPTSDHQVQRGTEPKHNTQDDASSFDHQHSDGSTMTRADSKQSAVARNREHKRTKEHEHVLEYGTSSQPEEIYTSVMPTSPPEEVTPPPPAVPPAELPNALVYEIPSVGKVASNSSEDSVHSEGPAVALKIPSYDKMNQMTQIKHALSNTPEVPLPGSPQDRRETEETMKVVDADNADKKEYRGALVETKPRRSGTDPLAPPGIIIQPTASDKNPTSLLQSPNQDMDFRKKSVGFLVEEQAVRSSKSMRSSNCDSQRPSYQADTDNDDDSFAVFSLWAAWERASISMSRRHESIQYKKEKLPITKDAEDSDSSLSDKSEEQRLYAAGEDGMQPVASVEHSFTPRGLAAFMLHPLSPVRVCWDVLTSILVAYECIIGPLQLLDLPKNIFLLLMDWVLRIFWSLDLPLNFITGVQLPNGHTEMRHSYVAKRYILRWFTLDIVLVAIDWFDFLLLIDGATTSRPILKALRMLRIVRLLRFFRVAVIQKRTSSAVMLAIQFYLKSEMFQIWMSLVKIVLIMLWVNHMVACIWFAIGETDVTLTWKSIMADYGYGHLIGYAYLTSFHWSLANFHGSMEIHPITPTERVFACCVMFFAFILAAWVVSSITSAMTRLGLASAQRTEKLMSLKQFLLDNNVSKRTIVRIQRNVQRHLEKEDHYRTEADVELLSIVSHSLRADLSFEIFIPTLSNHPFLREYQKDFPIVMKEVCFQAIKRLEVVRGEYLFYEDEMAPIPQMYFVRSGKLRYTQEGESLAGSKVQEGNWFCEQILWTPWSHCGSMRVSSRCASLLTLDSEMFIQIASRNSSHKRPCYVFGASYVAALNEAPDENLTDLTVDGIDLEELVNDSIISRRAVDTKKLTRAFSVASRAMTKCLDEYEGWQ